MVKWAFIVNDVYECPVEWEQVNKIQLKVQSLKFAPTLSFYYPSQVMLSEASINEGVCACITDQPELQRFLITIR